MILGVDSSKQCGAFPLIRGRFVAHRAYGWTRHRRPRRPGQPKRGQTPQPGARTIVATPGGQKLWQNENARTPRLRIETV